jgi:hypothetical protein
MSLQPTIHVHAAHDYRTGRPLWDLESWDVAGPREDRPPPGIPPDARYSHGYVTLSEQRSVYTRKLAPSPVPCPHCPATAP